MDATPERFYSRRRPELMKLHAAAEGTLARDPNSEYRAYLGDLDAKREIRGGERAL